MATATDRAWIFAVLIEDAPGSLMDVVSTFSYRGVSIESILGYGRPICGTGLIILGIRCPERRAAELDRVVRRLPVVSAVRRLPAPASASDRTVLIEMIGARGTGSAGESLAPGSPEGETDSAPAGLTSVRLTDQWALVSGSEPAVRRFLRGGIDRGEIGKHVEVLLA